MAKIKAEYLWIDGHKPTAKLRSKTKIIDGPVSELDQIPEWSFDGSSTMQAEGTSSDCLLKPVFYISDPVRGGNHIIVLNEVFNADGSVQLANNRARLREISERFSHEEAVFGIEQEYTFFDGSRPLGWPDKGYPALQGGHYCGIGADEVIGRKIVEDHMDACLRAQLAISGINAEVMPAQWEFQIGPVGPLEVSDQLWVARWLLYRIAEDHGISATLYPKPVKGDWNGAGAHTNFSTKGMRAEGGIKVIERACEKLGQNHLKHISIYGAHNEERLTGLHETCNINEFKWSISDRTASIRIPMQVATKGKGYLEDRRPSANMDPYLVTAAIIDTVCGE